MKRSYMSFVRKSLAGVVCCLLSSVVWSVPAYRGWQTRILEDGSEVVVRQIGDEFYHYWETKDGKLVIERKDGRFALSEKAVPTIAERKARRAAGRAARAHRMQKGVGSPNLAPRGVVILVNFSDSEMKDGHTRAVFDNMCNSTNCTTNGYRGVNYGSAAQYFADQSSGSYRPAFDVFGPVTLSHPTVYYGEQGGTEEEPINDMYLADFVIDAVKAADAAGCDFSQYDSDNDGWVDFVYFIYAGQGQASGGSSETIWPHNWSLTSALWWNYTHGTSGYFCNKTDCRVPQLDGKYINSYACSAELDNNKNLGGIGTLCHEFGHVIGLPDLYDTQYGDNYNNHLTPSEWDIMDVGSYNGNGHCPPNYDPWEKYFLGWVEPVNPGNEGTDGVLYSNGTTDYNVYQINASGVQQGATSEGWCYYIENRQQRGWDTFIPSHGMVIWKVNYNEEVWQNNAPNNTPGDPQLTIVCSSGTMIGVVWEQNETTGKWTLANDGTNNVFGPTSGVLEWKGVSKRPVTEISEADRVVRFKYMDGEGTDDTNPWKNWVYYDNGEYAISIGNKGYAFYWGIMIPGSSIEIESPKLSKIAVYESWQFNKEPITITIYEGGDIPEASNQVYTQTFDPTGENGFHEVALNQPVAFDPTKNLWVTMSVEKGTYPAQTSTDMGDPNGRWYSEDGVTWGDLNDIKLCYTHMLRAYIESDLNGIEWIRYDSTDSSRKVLRENQLIILRNGKAYNLLGTEVR